MKQVMQRHNAEYTQHFKQEPIQAQANEERDGELHPYHGVIDLVDSIHSKHKWDQGNYPQ